MQRRAVAAGWWPNLTDIAHLDEQHTHQKARGSSSIAFCKAAIGASFMTTGEAAQTVKGAKRRHKEAGRRSGARPAAPAGTLSRRQSKLLPARTIEGVAIKPRTTKLKQARSVRSAAYINQTL